MADEQEEYGGRQGHYADGIKTPREIEHEFWQRALQEGSRWFRDSVGTARQFLQTGIQGVSRYLQNTIKRWENKLLARVSEPYTVTFKTHEEARGGGEAQQGSPEELSRISVEEIRSRVALRIEEIAAGKKDPGLKDGHLKAFLKDVDALNELFGIIYKGTAVLRKNMPKEIRPAVDALPSYLEPVISQFTKLPGPEQCEVWPILRYFGECVEQFHRRGWSPQGIAVPAPVPLKRGDIDTWYATHYREQAPRTREVEEALKKVRDREEHVELPSSKKRPKQVTGALHMAVLGALQEIYDHHIVPVIEGEIKRESGKAAVPKGLRDGFTGSQDEDHRRAEELEGRLQGDRSDDPTQGQDGLHNAPLDTRKGEWASDIPGVAARIRDRQNQDKEGSPPGR